MRKKGQVIYYSDEINDDFGQLGIKRKPLGDNFKYIHRNPVWNTCSFIIYKIIAQPIAFVFTKVVLLQRFRNRQVMKCVKDKGAFIYANHTNFILDAFVPNLMRIRGRNYIVVGKDTTSIPGIKNLVEMLGAIPLGDNLKENKEMMNCIKERIAKKALVTIYPEAHLWPYYTGIRNFSASPFGYPCYTNTPVFALTNCYQKRKLGSRPKIVTYIDGPFFPDTSLPLKERKEKLRQECFNAMKERADKHSTYSFIEYRKECEEA